MGSGLGMSPATAYQIHGITLDADAGIIEVDLGCPRKILIHGENSKTGEKKVYCLSVTNSGRMILQ